MKYFSVISLLIVLSFGKCLAQSSTSWMGKLDSMTLESQALRYSKPNGFVEVGQIVCFDTHEMFTRMGKCKGNQLHAKDGEFIVFLNINRGIPEEEYANDNGATGITTSPHLRPIKYQIEATMGKDAAAKWKEYVDFYSPKEAKRKFNADNAISYSIPMPADEPYEDKYNNLKILILQKNDRSFVTIYCLYTDKAKERLPKYWRGVERIFRYDNCDPCAEVDFSTIPPVTITLDHLKR